MTTALAVLALALTPVGMFALIWLLVMAPSRWRSMLARPVAAPAQAARRRLHSVLRRPEPPVEVPDPFQALHLQMRLARLSAELEELILDERRFARGLRVQVTQAAYDDLLAEACALADVPLQRSSADDRKVGRLLEEVALAGRGWTW